MLMLPFRLLSSYSSKETEFQPLFKLQLPAYLPRRSSHTDVRICTGVEVGASYAADARGPQHKVLGRDRTVVKGHDVARVARVDLDELLAVGHHTRLDGKGRGDAVGAHRRRRRGLDDTDTGERVGLEVGACYAADARVPQHEVLGGDRAVVEGHDVARVARVDLDELVAVANHACLGRDGRGDAVGANYRCGSRRDRDRTGDADARVGASLEAGARHAANATIPDDELLGGDRAVEEGHDIAGIAWVD